MKIEYFETKKRIRVFTYMPMNGGSIVYQFVCYINTNTGDSQSVLILRLNPP